MQNVGNNGTYPFGLLKTWYICVCILFYMAVLIREPVQGHAQYRASVPGPEPSLHTASAMMTSMAKSP